MNVLKTLKAITIIICILTLNSCLLSRKISFEQTRNSLNTSFDVVLFSNVPSYAGNDSFHISIKKKLKPINPEDEGNIFIGEYANSENRKEISNTFNFIWISSDSLKIVYSKKLVVLKHKESSHGVTIIYEEKPR